MLHHIHSYTIIWTWHTHILRKSFVLKQDTSTQKIKLFFRSKFVKTKWIWRWKRRGELTSREKELFWWRRWRCYTLSSTSCLRFLPSLSRSPSLSYCVNNSKEREYPQIQELMGKLKVLTFYSEEDSKIASDFSIIYQICCVGDGR